MKTNGPYAVLIAVALLMMMGGGFGLLDFFGGQFREGGTSDLSLIGGGGALILGILFLVLADLGIRLVRIETKLGTLPKDDFSDDK
jgi:uncharacterized spore protein YtfJ